MLRRRDLVSNTGKTAVHSDCEATLREYPEGAAGLSAQGLGEVEGQEQQDGKEQGPPDGKQQHPPT